MISKQSERLWSDRIAHMVDQFNLSPKSCLDIGCRRGYLLLELQIYNWSTILGVTLDPSQAEIKECVDSLDKVEGAFDLITCIQNLDHFEPDKLLEWMASRLNPGGVILIESKDMDAMIEVLDRSNSPYLRIDVGNVVDVFVGERFASAKTEKVFYSFGSPDLSSQEEYLKWLGKSYGKALP